MKLVTSAVLMCLVFTKTQCECSGKYVIKCESLSDVAQYGRANWRNLVIGDARYNRVPNETLDGVIFENCGNLEQLTIIETVNKIDNFSFRTLSSSLVVLRLYNNSLNSFPKVITLSRLVKLDLQHNNIENVKRGFVTSTIKTINLSHNKIRTLGWVAFDYNRLQRLILSHNQIAELTDPSVFPRNLVYLNMDNNQLHNIQEDVFDKPNKLEELILSNNRFTTWWIKYRMKNLKTLDLSHNRINIVEPGVFEGMPNLTHLYLNHNHLKQLPLLVFRSNLEQDLKLTTLHLQNNLMEDLEFLLKDPWPALKEIVIAGNPWPCDCLDLILTFLGKKGIALRACDYQYFKSGNFPVCIFVNSVSNGECLPAQIPPDVYDTFLNTPRRYYCLLGDSDAYSEVLNGA